MRQRSARDKGPKWEGLQTQAWEGLPIGGWGERSPAIPVLALSGGGMRVGDEHGFAVELPTL